MIWSGS